jgi:hypothetical protein
VVAGLVVMVVVAACVSVEPAPLRVSSGASLGAGPSASSSHGTGASLPTVTPGPPSHPLPTLALPVSAAASATEPATPSETVGSPSTAGPADTAPSPLPSGTAEPAGSPAPTPSQRPRPTLAPGAGLGADTLESQDDFSQAGNWGTATSATGSVAYTGGKLAITVNTATSGLWSWHIPPLPDPHRVLRVEGTIDVGGSRGGLMCGNGTPDFLFGVISWDGKWYIGSIISRTTATLDSGDLPDGALPDSNGLAHLSVECAVTGGIADRILLRVNGIQVADFDAAPQLGPFDHAAVYGEAGDSPPQTVTFDDVKVTSGDTYTPNGKLDPAVQDLLARVPSDYRSNCTPNQPAAGSTVIAGLMCTPAGDVDTAQYYQYQNKATMNAAFDFHLTRDGQNATGIDCQQRSSTVNYTIRNPNTGVPEHAGRLACYADPDSTGRLYMWTDEKLSILSFGVSSGSYLDLWNWWLDAGPNR